MRLKIWCDRESEKFYKIFWELNKAQQRRFRRPAKVQPHIPSAGDGLGLVQVENFFGYGTVAFSFVCGKYSSIIN